MKVGALVLAAGASTRMGGENKLLADLSGRPLVWWAVVPLVEAGVDPIVVVTGAAHDEIVAALPSTVRSVRNPHPEHGMSGSIAVGVGALDPGVDGFLVMLGDLPFVRAADVEALIAAFDPERAPVCVPVHQGRRGHPVLWARRFGAELSALRGDVGARAVLDANAVTEVAVEHPGILVDVDTPDALARARRGP